MYVCYEFNYFNAAIYTVHDVCAIISHSSIYKYTKTMTSQKFLCEMNNCYMTYLVVPHINDRLSINCKAFDIVI